MPAERWHRRGGRVNAAAAAFLTACAAADYNPAIGWGAPGAMTVHTFFCIDAHTCGNPVRVVAGGGPLLKGGTAGERRQHFLKEYDWIRRGLMFEPRGHDMMSGSIL